MLLPLCVDEFVQPEQTVAGYNVQIAVNDNYKLIVDEYREIVSCAQKRRILALLE